MDTDALKTLVGVISQGSFSKYADSHYLSKMSVKRRIDSLEREVGVRLLQRGTWGIEPTAAGQVLYERLGPILESLDRALEEARTAKAGNVVRLTVSSVVSMPHLREVYAAFSKGRPDADLVLYPTYGADFIPSVVEGRSDVCVTVYDPSLGKTGISHVPVGKVATCCLVRRGHILSKREHVRVEDLFRRDVGGNEDVYAVLAHTLKAKGSKFTHLTLSEENMTGIVAFIQSGGCFIVPASYTGLFDIDAVVLPMKGDSAVELQKSVIMREDSPEYVRDLAAVLQTVWECDR